MNYWLLPSPTSIEDQITGVTGPYNGLKSVSVRRNITLSA